MEHNRRQGVLSAAYNMDGMGNNKRKYHRLGGGTLTYTPHTANAFNAYSAIGGVNQTHDANGNLIYDGNLYYEWDVFDRLQRVKQGHAGGLVVATYWYDAENRRIRKCDTSAAWNTDYLYAGWRVVAEYAVGENVLRRQFVYGNYIDEPLAMISLTGGTALYYYQQDANYNVMALVNDAGVKVEGYIYDPYGRHQVFYRSGAEVRFWSADPFVVGGASNYSNPYTFTGRRFDPETGLHYYRNRYYSSARERFISRDPIGVAGGINLYGYVAGRVMVGKDPMGFNNLLMRPIFQANRTNRSNVQVCCAPININSSTRRLSDYSPRSLSGNAT